VRILVEKLIVVGVIASHEEYPIERMKLDRHGRWLGSVSHDLCIKLTDVQDLFEESDGEGEEESAEGGDSDDAMDSTNEAADDEEVQADDPEDEDAVEDSDVDMDTEGKKKKTTKTTGGMGDLGKQKPADDFFSGL
jgi:hypothetical protein